MQNIYLHAEYSKIFGKPVPNLETLIPSRVSDGSLIFLSMISFTDRDEELEKYFLDCLPLSNEGRKEIKKFKFNKRPSNFILWVELLNKDIDSITVSNFKVEDHIESVISPLIAINEKTDIENDELLYIIRNSLYSYQDNPLHQFYRAVQIYLENPVLAKYHKLFKNYFNISLKEYILICHMINSIYTSTDNWQSASHWILNIPAFSRSTGLDKEVIKKVIDIISFDQTELKEYAKSKDYRDHRFNFFANKPFYNMGNDCYIPVDGKMSQNLVFNQLYYRVKDCVPDKKQFMSDFGKAFEEYSVGLIEYVAKNSTSIKYNFIPEFPYQGHNERHKKLSSDAYLYFHDQAINEDIVLVFEIKSARILNKSRMIDEDHYYIDKSVSKLTTQPIEQQVRVTSEIVKSKTHKEITKNKIYYFISISMDDFPLNIGKNIQLSEICIKHLKDLRYGYFYSFSIEELEILCKLISNDLNCPVNFILQTYMKGYSDMSFKTFLLRFIKTIKYKNSNFVDEMLKSQDILYKYIEELNR